MFHGYCPTSIHLRHSTPPENSQTPPYEVQIYLTKKGHHSPAELKCGDELNDGAWHVDRWEEVCTDLRAHSYTLEQLPRGATLELCVRAQVSHPRRQLGMLRPQFTRSRQIGSARGLHFIALLLMPRSQCFCAEHGSCGGLEPKVLHHTTSHRTALAALDAHLTLARRSRRRMAAN